MQYACLSIVVSVYMCDVSFVIIGFVQRDSNLSTSLIHGQKVFQVTQAPPDIQEALQNDDKWEYDILKLERVSNKRYETCS